MRETQRREREFHNRVFKVGTRNRILSVYSVRRRSEALYDSIILENSEGKAVLEWGCGLGAYAFQLAKRGGRVVGIDVSNVAIQQAKARAKEEDLDIDFLLMDAEDMAFDEGFFDLI